MSFLYYQELLGTQILNYPSFFGQRIRFQRFLQATRHKKTVDRLRTEAAWCFPGRLCF
jgi:hypothetical protein